MPDTKEFNIQLGLACYAWGVSWNNVFEKISLEARNSENLKKYDESLDSYDIAYTFTSLGIRIALQIIKESGLKTNDLKFVKQIAKNISNSLKIISSSKENKDKTKHFDDLFKYFMKGGLIDENENYLVMAGYFFMDYLDKLGLESIFINSKQMKLVTYKILSDQISFLKTIICKKFYLLDFLPINKKECIRISWSKGDLKSDLIMLAKQCNVKINFLHTKDSFFKKSMTFEIEGNGGDIWDFTQNYDFKYLKKLV